MFNSLYELLANNTLFKTNNSLKHAINSKIIHNSFSTRYVVNEECIGNNSSIMFVEAFDQALV